MSRDAIIEAKKVLNENASGILYKINHGIKEGWS